MQPDQTTRQRVRRQLARASGCLLVVLTLHSLVLQLNRPPPSTFTRQAEAVHVRNLQPTPGHPALVPVTHPRPEARAPALSATRGARPATPSPAPAAATAAPVDWRPYLPPSATLAYRWQQGERDEPALLDWQAQDTRYRLQLSTQRQGAQRPTAWWHSQGGLGPDGLLPERHTARQAPGSERALTFVRDHASTQVWFSARTSTAAVPAEAQDSLSWLPQLMARVAAGQRQALITVAEVGGSVQDWWLQADTTEPWRWQRRAESPEHTQVTLWLCPLPPHWPQRLRLVPAWGTAIELQQTAPCDGAPFQ